jgi:ABC-2 type transport system permease protein
MRTIWIITKRELHSYFDSLIAYVMIVLFLGFSGFFTWIYGSDIFLVGQASLRTFFSIAYWTLFFFIPALTMKSLAEEKRSGTLELLLTKPVSEWQLIWGKFLGSLLVIGIALALTIPYIITLSSIGNFDLGASLMGYLGLLLMSAAYIGIGIFTSSISTNQIVAFLSALFVGLFFHIIFGVLANNMSGSLGGIFSFLDLNTHFESIARGVLDTKDIIYFASIMFVGLYMSVISLAKRNMN